MAKQLDVQTQKSFNYLKEVEEVAQNVLTDKRTKLDLSNALNTYREAYRALQKVDERQSWIQLGLVHVKLPTEQCKKLLEREMEAAETDINDLHERIKDNVHKLRDLEHEPRLEGYGLKPLSAAEAKAIKKGFSVT